MNVNILKKFSWNLNCYNLGKKIYKWKYYLKDHIVNGKIVIEHCLKKRTK